MVKAIRLNGDVEQYNAADAIATENGAASLVFSAGAQDLAPGGWGSIVRVPGARVVVAVLNVAAYRAITVSDPQMMFAPGENDALRH